MDLPTPSKQEMDTSDTESQSQQSHPDLGAAFALGVLQPIRRSINDPAHCLSRLVCGTQALAVPAEVRLFQARMRQRQKLLDQAELATRLQRAASERNALEAKVAHLRRHDSPGTPDSRHKRPAGCERCSDGAVAVKRPNHGVSLFLDCPN